MYVYWVGIWAKSLRLCNMYSQCSAILWLLSIFGAPSRLLSGSCYLLWLLSSFFQQQQQPTNSTSDCKANHNSCLLIYTIHLFPDRAIAALWRSFCLVPTSKSLTIAHSLACSLFLRSRRRPYRWVIYVLLQRGHFRFVFLPKWEDWWMWWEPREWKRGCFIKASLAPITQ